MRKAADFVAPIALSLCGFLLVLVFEAVPVSAQSADSSPSPSATSTPAAMDQQQRDAQAALIKESQNPVGNITLIQFQNNVNYGYGPYSRDQYDLNVQPVVPFELKPNLSLVARFITPFVEWKSCCCDDLRARVEAALTQCFSVARRT